MVQWSRQTHEPMTGSENIVQKQNQCFPFDLWLKALSPVNFITIELRSSCSIQAKCRGTAAVVQQLNN